MATKITKEFLDRVLTIGVLKKYTQYKEQLHFDQSYIDWAHVNLIGLGWRQARRLFSKKHNKLMDHARKNNHDFTDRNEFAKVMHCVMYELDHGYRKGQEVEYWFSKHTKRTGVIRSVGDRNMVALDDIILPVERIVDHESDLGQISFDF